MSDPVERAVGSALPSCTVATIEPQTVRPGNHTARVDFENADPVYVKTATDTSRRLEREIAATRYAAAHSGVETPPIVAADAGGEPPYLATEPLPGTIFNDAWRDDGDRGRLLRLVGRAIAGVHEARFDRSGVVEGGDRTGLDLVGEDWADVLCRTVEWRADDWFPDRFDDLPERLVSVIREFDPAVAGTPTLLHCDPSRINVHFEPLGMLDWERAMVGDPAFGLVEAAFHHLEQPDVSEEERRELEAALHEGYRERAGDLPTGLERNRPLYRAISHMLVPQAFEDWSSDVDRPNDELAANVREAFTDRLERARAAA
ncbi:aminoglycoside phosphotransferase [Salinarchaeum sp. Harcht-Bsk1]|uniref:phosphotransferase family protein n=1 Tax=Salinarchaeum sp. Harcht-Bsk1 TaxID=1333523 RepID=UPI00034247B7|nr:aminoglycoside phosphotransferase family protein [Salinarchaeum sp. Harcht-Bsk1]AGN00574.1 aminoglycoside phosphotransferase [Salinarchaeum sp. Harcht-Bsk1]